MFSMQSAIEIIIKIPKIPDFIELSKDEESVLFRLQRFNKGLEYWLKDLLLPNNVIKENFEEEFIYSRPYADLLYAFYTLCCQLQPKYPLLIKNANALWSIASYERVQAAIRHTGLFGDSITVSKVDHVQAIRAIAKSLQNHEAFFIGNLDTWDIVLLLAQETAWESATFDDEVFQPFLKKLLKYAEQIQQCEKLQLQTLTPERREYVTGKGKKMPKSLKPSRMQLVKHEELLQISHFAVKNFLEEVLLIKLSGTHQKRIAT